MRKIPTLFVRDPENMKYVLPEPNPACAWVFAGEGVPTAKVDGVCVKLDNDGWWARREVKPDKTPPPNWVEVDADPVTGKRQGWEPMRQSAFAKYLDEATADPFHELTNGTYELVGAKINGDPHGYGRHQLIRHGAIELDDVQRDYRSLRLWLATEAFRWEGIVYHHPDGRAAKIKCRDFPAVEQ